MALSFRWRVCLIDLSQQPGQSASLSPDFRFRACRRGAIWEICAWIGTRDECPFRIHCAVPRVHVLVQDAWSRGSVPKEGCLDHRACRFRCWCLSSSEIRGFGVARGRAGGSGGVRRAAPAGRGVGRKPGLAWQAAALHVLAPDACARPFRSRSGQEQRAMVESVVARSSLADGAVTFPLQGVGFCVSCTLLLRASRPAPVACKFQVVCLATPGLRVLPSRPVQQPAISARPFARISPTPSARAAPACSEPVPRQL